MINYSLTPPLLLSGFVGVNARNAVIRPRLTVARIQTVVADFYNIRFADMTSARRGRSVARPRQVAMYLAKQLTPKSTPDIGRRFGGRDHTTVLHAIKQIDRFMLIDGDMADDVETLTGMLGA